MKRYWKEPIPQNAPRLYRAEAWIYGYLDDEYHPASTFCRVGTVPYFVVRKTQRGCWVTTHSYAPMHFIRNNAKKRFAWPTELEALESLVARKENEIWHLERRLEDARKKLGAARNELRAKRYSVTKQTEIQA